MIGAAGEGRTTSDWSGLVRAAAASLAAAGVDAPRVDAELLAAHVLGRDRGTAVARILAGARPDEAQAEAYAALVARRAAREPLQHLTGTAAFHGLELAVGPGVFVPRPETETLVDEALRRAVDRSAETAAPLRVVDLCTGSGAIAAAVAAGLRERSIPAEVTAVELDSVAAAWASRNLAPLGVHLRQGDALVACADLDGLVDLVVSNPPYVPDDEVPEQEEARRDPALALYGGGERGLEVPRGILRRATVLLRPGGSLLMEHHETQGGELAAAAVGSGVFEDVRILPDPAGRDRFLAARRGPAAELGGVDGTMAP